MTKIELLQQAAELGVYLEGTPSIPEIKAAIGQVYLKDEPLDVRQAYELRLQVNPQQCYSYENLDFDSQVYLELDTETSNVALEEKYDGVRMMFVYLPRYGFYAFGRGISTVNFLPTDYTDKILLEGKRLYEYAKLWKAPFIIDAELLSAKGLEEVVRLLAMNSPESLREQSLDNPLYAVAFDYLPVIDGKVETNYPYISRRQMLLYMAKRFQIPDEYANLRTLVSSSHRSIPMELSVLYYKEKERAYRDIVKRKGEGAVYKHIYAPYFAGQRTRFGWIKRKSTLLERGIDIDAYIIGYKSTPAYNKQNLIGSLQMGVNVIKDDGSVIEPYYIATISDMPMQIRARLSNPDGSLCEEYYSAVLKLNGKAFSKVTHRLVHAVADWNRGFRQDKNAEDCTLSANLLKL